MSPPDDAAGPSLRWGGHLMQLMPGKAVWLPERRWLLVADVHLGKAASFRRSGVPVPSGTTGETLSRLGALLQRLGASRLVVLGDLLHSAVAQSAAVQQPLARWREQHAGIAMTLVRGNHDARAGDPVPSLGIELVDEPWCLSAPIGADAAGSAAGKPLAPSVDLAGPSVPGSGLLPPAHRGLALCHHPQRVGGHQVLAGHDHPCVQVSGRARERLRLPCYHFAGDIGVVPAFGGFTGMHPVRREAGDQVYAVAGDTVLPLGPVACVGPTGEAPGAGRCLESP